MHPGDEREGAPNMIWVDGRQKCKYYLYYHIYIIYYIYGSMVTKNAFIILAQWKINFSKDVLQCKQYEVLQKYYKSVKNHHEHWKL